MFECPNCDDEFDSKRSLAAHKGHCNRSEDSTYTCDGCGKTFSNPSALGGHRKGCDASDTSKKEYTCVNCDNTFEDYESRREQRGRENFYCSRTCKDEHQKDGEERKCSNCGSNVWVPKCRLNEMGGYPINNHFCDKGCEIEWKKNNLVKENHPSWDGGKEAVVCGECNEEYMVYPCLVDSSQFCSKKCADKNQRVNKISLSCANCGETVEKKPYNVRGEETTCSQECLSEYLSSIRRGDENPCWRGGNPDYYGDNWLEKREEAIERDDNECAVCGIGRGKHIELYDQDLSVHHKIPIRTFDEPEDANYLTNLITVCRACHQTVEKISRDWQQRRLQVETMT